MRYLQLKFQQRLQNHLEYRDDIRTIDIEYFFTKGQETYIDTVHDRYKGEESLRKRLSGVYKESLLDAVTSRSDYDAHRTLGEVWELPDGVRYILDEYVMIDGIQVPVKPVDASYYNKQSKNPFKRPYNNLIWRLDRGYRDGRLMHELVRSNSSMEITGYGVVYVKTPAPVKLTVVNDNELIPFEVVDEYHDEILDLAVNFALDTYRISGAFRPENTTPSGK